MATVYLVEWDNNEEYDLHRRWAVAVAASVEDAVRFIREEKPLKQDYFYQMYDYTPDPAHDAPVQQSTGQYLWDWFRPSTFSWSDPITFVITPYEVYGGLERILNG